MRGINKIKLTVYMNKIRFKLLFGILIISQLIGCSRKLTPEEYVKYYEKNRDKYSAIVERNGVKATVYYLPNELHAAREMITDSSLIKDSAIKKYNHSIFFAFQITSEDFKNGSILLERNGISGFCGNVLKNNFDRGFNFFLVCENDTARLNNYTYERNWGLGNTDTFLLMFEKNEIRNNLSKYRLIIRNLVSELGTIDIKLCDLLKRVPKLKG